MPARFGTSRDQASDLVDAAEEVEGILGTLPPGLGMLDVMELSLDAMQSLLTRYRLAGYPPDLLITVPKNACRVLEFHKAREMIALGREVADRALDEGPLSVVG